MKWILCVLVSLPLAATDKVNFLNLRTTVEGDKVLIETDTEPLLEYRMLKNEAFNLRKTAYDHTLDAPFRQTAFLMRTLERNRGSIYKDKSQPLMVIKYPFQLAVREVTGKVVQMNEYDVIVGLDTEDDTGIITLDGGGKSHKFSISKLRQPKEYAAFLNNLVFPYGQIRMPKPAGDEFLVDLYYKWPRTVVPESDFNVFDLFPSAILWDKGDIRKLRLHMGTTYVYKSGDEWKQVNSEHPRVHKRALQQYDKVLELIKEDDLDEIIPALEEYVTNVPGDKIALKKLMDYYLKDYRTDEAYNLISRYQPFFATIRDGLDNQDALREKASRRRNWLLGRKATFEKDENVKLKILTPTKGDLVTGTTEMTFSLADNPSKVLEIECFLEDQKIARLTEPPYKTNFTVNGNYGFLTLRVVAYFEDETFQEDEIRIRTFKVDQEEQVNLVALRASVFNPGRELTKEDFRVRENKEDKQIENFRKDQAPLRLAILLDTSISMFGPKLYRAQYAVKTFISKLEPEDRVSIYTFGSNVMKLSDFTNDFDGITPPLMTLSPYQWGTKLYDGMLIAHDALMGQNGTKVMIVISDGDDSGSSTSDIHVASALRGSSVMVYSIILPGGFLGSAGQGEYFLSEMARLTGSISTRVRSVGKLDQTFEKVYQDLKSFYYLDYYSTRKTGDRDVDVRLVGAKGKLRVRAIN
ncbi:MAG: VWA domain-containing protein [Acidobacteriota bacterium]|nr:VWA domain-containing protein [Acidobacteriota bacterium]